MQGLDLSDTSQRNARTRIRNRVLSAYFDARYLRYIHERDRGLIFQNARNAGYDLHFREGLKEFVRFTYRGLLEDEHDIDIAEILETAIAEAEQEYATAAGENVTFRVDIDVTRVPGDSVAELERRLADEGMNVTKRREHGDPAEVITTVAAELDADRIVMSGRKRSPTGKVLFGSVTQSVLLDADRPVTVLMED
jgi:nucleotide-binding universal stress UspA family protein